MHECRRELVQQKDKISYSFIEKEINVRTKKQILWIQGRLFKDVKAKRTQFFKLNRKGKGVFSKKG